MSLSTRIKDAIKNDTPFFSLEFFPPRTPQGFQKLMSRITHLSKLEPMFINVTWRNFENRQPTLDLCDWIQNKLGVEVMMHLTCVGLTKSKAKKILSLVKRIGVRNLLVLRGDAAATTNQKDCSSQKLNLKDNTPQRKQLIHSTESHFAYAKHLVRFIRQTHGDFFGIAVAGFCERKELSGGNHDNASNVYFSHLKEKMDAGADLIITQMFFNAKSYSNFVNDCRKFKITAPVCAGLMTAPTSTFLERVATHFKICMPLAMKQRLRMMGHRPTEYKHYISKYLVDLATKLREQKAPGLHFFTMNTETLVDSILTKLGFRKTVASRRKLPWRSSGRRNENVRPIFWSNRQQSYFARTSSWEDLPTGRWEIKGKMNWEAPETSNGAAGGSYENADCGNDHLRIPRSTTERRIHWGNALATADDIGNIFIRYLQGQIPFLPWCEEELNAETLEIREKLVHINHLGFWSINSQPRICGLPSTNPTFGWGTAGGYVYQKAYVEFFCSAAKLQIFMQVIHADKYGAMSYIASDVNGNMYTNSKFRGPTAVTWGVFVNKEVLQPTIVDHESFMVWKDEAFSLWLKTWASIYESDSRSYSLIQNIHDTYFLVSVVDNDFMHGDIFRIFHMVEQRMNRHIGSLKFSSQSLQHSSPVLNLASRQKSATSISRGNSIYSQDSAVFGKPISRYSYR